LTFDRGRSVFSQTGLLQEKKYRLTRAGQRQLKAETEDWQRISLAIANALQAT
jgi:hypothetical protein